MAFYFGKRSEECLKGIHIDLAEVFRRALEISEVDFAITEGIRSKERQQELIKSGDSWTMNGRHLDGHAGDLAAYINGEISWDWEWYDKIAEAMYRAAIEKGFQIEWGGLWNEDDMCHWQLSRKEYP